MLRVVGAREGTADALDRAHRAGVTHHDINLGNLMLTRDGVKVLDFRIAKSTAKPGPTEATIVASLTSEGTVLGTPQYMPPEQFEGKKADPRADVWAFGAVLYEMLTGQGVRGEELFEPRRGHTIHRSRRRDARLARPNRAALPAEGPRGAMAMCYWICAHVARSPSASPPRDRGHGWRGPSLPLPPSPLWFLGLTSSEEGKQQVYVQSMQSLGAKPLAGTGGAVASEHWAGARFITSPLPAFGKFAIALPQYALR